MFKRKKTPVLWFTVRFNWLSGNKKEFDEHEFNPDTKQLGLVVEKHYRINTKLNLPKEVKNLNKQIRIAEELISERNATVFLNSDATYLNEAVDTVENADIC